MQFRVIEAKIFYRFKPDELSQLDVASIPLATQIRAVSSETDYGRWRFILGGMFFRASEAKAVHIMLTRAARYARAHLDEYFPTVRPEMIGAIEQFEEAVTGWWEHFQHDQRHVEPTT